MSTKTIHKFSRWYIPFARKNRFVLLTAALVLLAAAFWPILTMLRINNNLASLLPENTPSVVALKESYTRFGSTDRFMIAIRSKDPQLVADLQVEIRQRILELWKDEIVTSPQIDNDNSFFKDNALLYLPVTHLERIRNNLEEIQNELGRENLPLVVDLLGSIQQKQPDAPKAARVWFDASLPQELGLPDEASEAFDDFFVKKADTSKGASEQDNWSPKANLPSHLKTRLIGQPRGDSLFNGIVQCKLIRPSTDMEFVLHILGKSESLLGEFRARTYPVPVQFSVEGTYEGLQEIEDLKSDGNRAFIISAILIVLLVAWFFRSFIAPVVLVSQVLFACALMLSLTALWYGQLNPFTLFVASIILGMGVDYSIHLMGTCQRFLVQFSGNLEESLIHTLEHLLRPMFLAALTTIAGLLTLLIAQFTGFYEFGVIASVGIFLSFSSAILGLPVLLFIVGGLPAAPKKSLLPASWDEARTWQVLRRTAVTLLVVCLTVGLFAPFAEFEYNFQKLRRPSRDEGVQKGIATSVAIASSRKTSTPAAVMGDDPAQLDQLYDTLMVRLHKEKDPMLRSFLTLKTFVPSQEDQNERLEVIEEISELIGARVFDRATGEDSTNIANLRNLVTIEDTFGPEDIPEWALDLLREKDGSYGKIGFIYGNYPSWDARAVATFQDRYGHWKFNDKDLRVFSSQFILSDVIRAVKQDSVRMGFFITAVIILTLIFSLRHTRMVLASSLTLLLGILLTIGAMGFLTLFFDVAKVGIYNVIVIPTILGVAIDSTIHMLVAWVQGGGMTLRKLYDSTGRMVIASSLTTAAGFFGVLLVTHRGMRTIGELAVLGIILFLITSLVFTPYFCKLWLQKEGDEKSYG